jgi:hypothetical protein
MIRVLTIETNNSNRQRTAEYGQYNVVIDVDDVVHCLEYTCELGDYEGLKMQTVTWKPENSILADRDAIEVMVVAAITDTVMQYHRGGSIQLPRTITPRPVGPDTDVIQL